MEAQSLEQLAALVDGEVSGDRTVSISGAWPLDDAAPGSITLIDDACRLNKLQDTPAAAAVIPADAPEVSLPAIRVKEVHTAFATIVCHFRPVRPTVAPGVHPSAIVDPSAGLGQGVSIGEGAIIGAGVYLGDNVTIGAQSVVQAGCRVGDESWLAPRVTLYPETVLGKRCRVHGGAVLGADGFGYRQVEGRHVPVAQLGNVELGDDVEIGANTTIDRGVYGPTKIGDGTKIDNLVQIGHNCHLGRHNLICAQVGIAGSTSTGEYVVMAGQAGVRDHVHIGTGAILSAMAGVANNVPDGATMLGAPAAPVRDQKLQMAAVAKLPQMRKDFRALKREVERLTGLLSNDPPAEDASRAA